VTSEEEAEFLCEAYYALLLSADVFTTLIENDGTLSTIRKEMILHHLVFALKSVFSNIIVSLCDIPT
jgi:hypothetical protein